MHTTQLVALISLGIALSLNHVRADVDVQSSLYIPLASASDSVSVDVLGVGPNQETTYELHIAQPTDTLTPIAVATLVEGPSDAVLSAVISGVTAVVTCDIANGIAQCDGLVNGQTVTVLTETPSPIPIDLGATAIAATPTSSSGFITSTRASGSRGTASSTSTIGSAGTSSSSQQPSGTTKPNGGKRINWSSLAGIIGLSGMLFTVL